MNVENTWFFPLLEAVHLMGLAMLVGTIVLGDLATLGWAPPRGTGFSMWTRSGLVVTLSTGIVMFMADTDRYLSNPAFAAKVGVLIIATLLYRARSQRWGAMASLALWTLAVLASRAIIDFDV